MGWFKDIGDWAGGVWDDISGQTAAGMAQEAAAVSAGYQKEALEYLKEAEALPRQFSEAALTQLAGAYGLGGMTSEEFMASAKASPYYQAIMSGQDAGEEAIMRQRAATGGLRSGTTQEALYDYGTQLQNQALQSYTGGLSNLAAASPYTSQIAQQYGNIGQTYAQGGIAAAQAQQAGMSNLMSLAGMVAGAV